MGASGIGTHPDWSALADDLHPPHTDEYRGPRPQPEQHRLSQLSRRRVSGSIDTDEIDSSMQRIDFILARIAELVHEGDFVVIENNAFNAIGRARVRARRAERNRQILVVAARDPVCSGRRRHAEEVYFGRGQGREIVHYP